MLPNYDKVTRADVTLPVAEKAETRLRLPSAQPAATFSPVMQFVAAAAMNFPTFQNMSMISLITWEQAASPPLGGGQSFVDISMRGPACIAKRMLWAICHAQKVFFSFLGFVGKPLLKALFPNTTPLLPTQEHPGSSFVESGSVVFRRTT